MVGTDIVKKIISQGKSVRVLKYRTNNFSHLKNFDTHIEYIDGDLLDIISLEDALVGIEQIYHCAEIFSFNTNDEQKMFDVNIAGTRNLVNVALSKSVKKILLLSSTLAFGTYDFKKPINEKTKWEEHKDNTSYSISKHQAELEIFRGKAEGLETVIVNPSFILGEAINKNALYNLINIANLNYKFCPTLKYGFVDLEDVSNSCIQLMESSVSGEKYILNAENLSLTAVLKKINSNVNPKNYKLSSLRVTLNEIKTILFKSKPFLTKEVYNFEGKTFEFENVKIKETLKLEFKLINK